MYAVIKTDIKCSVHAYIYTVDIAYKSRFGTSALCDSYRWSESQMKKKYFKLNVTLYCLL